MAKPSFKVIAQGLNRWLRFSTPRWTVIKALKANRLEALSRICAVACPAVAVAIEYLEESNLIQPKTIVILKGMVPDEMVVAYLIAVPYAVGTKLFDLTCPEAIRTHANPNAFMQAFSHKLDLQAESFSILGDAIYDELSVLTGDILSTTSTPETLQAHTNYLSRDALTENAHPAGIWQNLDRSRTWARTVVFALLLISIVMSIIVIIWTTPVHVFHVRTPAQIINYLFGDNKLNVPNGRAPSASLH